MHSVCYHSIMTIPNEHSALILFAHGSADPGWAAPFIKLKAAVQAKQPGRKIELAFLERMSPSFEETVTALHAQGIRHITVAPIFLAIGGHMRKDLPKLIIEMQLRTEIEFQILPALGEVDSLITAIADWVVISS